MKILQVHFLVLYGLFGGIAGGAEWVFEGNSQFSNTRILQALSRFDSAPASGSDVMAADDAAFFLREFYFSQGFPDAAVTYDFSAARVVFSIDEGGQLWIRRLIFEGGTSIASDRLNRIFTAAVRQANRTAFGRLRYVALAVEQAGESLRQAFVNEGFLDASLTIIDQPAADFKTVDLTIVIDEGIPYRVGRIRLEGPGFEESKELSATLSPFENRPFRPSDQVLSQSRALDFLRSRGYYFAAVSVENVHTDTPGIVDLVVTPVPGPRMHIGKVRTSGAQRTAERSLLGRFGIRRGAVYNATALDAAERRLWFTGAFSSVDVAFKPAANDTLDVEIQVEERDRRSLAVTVGYSEWYLAFASATYTDRNFLGTLDRLKLTGFISQKSFGGEAEVSDPWLFGTELTGSLEAFAVRKELPAFKVTEFGTRLGISQKLNETSRTGWGLVYEWKSVSNAVIASGSEPDTLEDYRLGQLTFRQELDRRNDPLVPTSGFDLRYEAGVAAPPLLGELSFVKATAQATWYLPLQKIAPGRPFVPFFTFNHRAGVILPFGNTTSIPVPERFFLGGPDSVRSFQFDGMAPRDNAGTPLGGEAFLQANIELQWPVGRGFFLAVFTDAGNLAASIDEMEFNETRIAPGAGIRFYTPLGALRMDYGYNLVRRDGDPIGAWQFGLGVMF